MTGDYVQHIAGLLTMLLAPRQGSTTTIGPKVALLRGEDICQQTLIPKKESSFTVKQDRLLTLRKSRSRLVPSPDKAVGSLVSGALQLDYEVLIFDLRIAGGGVIIAAHVHVVHDGHAAQRRVQQRLAHQPVCQVTRTRHLQHASAIVKPPSALLRLKTRTHKACVQHGKTVLQQRLTIMCDQPSAGTLPEFYELHMYHCHEKL